jgi:hypothetical protein
LREAKPSNRRKHEAASEICAWVSEKAAAPEDCLSSITGPSYDYGNLGGRTHDNADICTLRFASLADCNSAPEAQRNPTAPIKKSPARQLEEPKNNTQEEECCPEDFEEDISDQTWFSNRPIYTIFKSPLTSRARQRYVRCLRNSPSGPK